MPVAAVKASLRRPRRRRPRAWSASTPSTTIPVAIRTRPRRSSKSVALGITGPDQDRFRRWSSTGQTCSQSQTILMPTTPAVAAPFRAISQPQLVVVTGGKYFAYTADTTGLSTILGKIGASSLFISPSSGAQTYSVIGVPGMAYGKADQKSWDSLPGLIRRSNCPDLVDTDVVGRTLSQRIRRNRRAATDHLGPRSAFWFIRIQGSIESPRIPKRVN